MSDKTKILRFWIESRIVKNENFKRINPNAKLVYFTLNWYRGGRNRHNQNLCWPSIKTLAEYTKLSTSTIKRSIKILVACGLIKKQRISSGKDSRICYNQYELIENPGIKEYKPIKKERSKCHRDTLLLNKKVPCKPLPIINLGERSVTGTPCYDIKVSQTPISKCHSDTETILENNSKGESKQFISKSLLKRDCALPSAKTLDSLSSSLKNKEERRLLLEKQAKEIMERESIEKANKKAKESIKIFEIEEVHA